MTDSGLGSSRHPTLKSQAEYAPFASHPKASARSDCSCHSKSGATLWDPTKFELVTGPGQLRANSGAEVVQDSA